MMEEHLPSRKAIDRLGERLKQVPIADEDLTLLTLYRNAHATNAEQVKTLILSVLPAIQPSFRRSKSRISIINKLRRQPTLKLSQIQDVVGCRIVVDTLTDQTDLIGTFQALFEDVKIKDRRVITSHGYRAVHMVWTASGRHFEIQIRTHLQHEWAKLSEAGADMFGVETKYGQQESPISQSLAFLSDVTKHLDQYIDDIVHNRPVQDSAVESAIMTTDVLFDAIKKTLSQNEKK